MYRSLQLRAFPRCPIEFHRLFPKGFSLDLFFLPATLPRDFSMTSVSSVFCLFQIFTFNRRRNSSVALDCRAQGRGYDSRGRTNTQGFKNNWEIKVLSWPCKRLDLRITRMTTWNGDPVSSGRRRIVSSISTLVWNRWHSNKVHLFYFTVFSELFWSINNFFHYQKRLAIWVHFSSPTRKRKLPNPPPQPHQTFNPRCFGFASVLTWKLGRKLSAVPLS